MSELASETAAVPPEPSVSAKKPSVISPRAARVLIGAGIALAVVLAMTAVVYLRPATSGAVRAVTRVLPYPVAIVGSDVITFREYLDERDALEAYFQSTADETGTAPTEAEIAANLVDTLVHKSAVNHLAREAGIEADPARVDAFYAEAVGGADSEQFAAQLESMFGWSVDEFRDRVVAPVVLAMQLGESIEQDAELQDARRATAAEAYARLEAGEEFAVVAGDTSSDFSATTGGDVGYVKMSEIPEEWIDSLSGLSTGQHSSVLEGMESFLIFQVTDRMEAGADTEVRLSIISIPKVTLEEAVQEYLESVPVVRLIGRT